MPSRRELMKGVLFAATAGVVGGLLRDFDARADMPGSTGAVKRLVVVNAGHGIGSGISAANASPLGSHQSTISDVPLVLPAFMAPLATFRDRMLVLDQLYNLSEDTLHGSRRGAYSCLTAVQGASFDTADSLGDFHGPTFESLIAQSLGTPGIYLGGATPYNETLFASATSSGSPGALPLEVDPAKAFLAIFGDTMSDADARAVLLGKKKSVLDFNMTQIQKASASLPAAERPKLDQLLASVRALEQQISGQGLPTPGAACGAPASTVLGVSPPQEYTRFDACHPDLAKQLKLQIEVLVHSLACAKTRVAALQISRQTDYSVYPGIADAGHQGQTNTTDLHNLYHAYMRDDWHNYLPEFSEPQPDPDQMRLLHQEFIAAHVAYLAYRLSQFTDYDGGTLLDNTMILWMSDSGGQHHGGASAIPAVLLGGRDWKRGRMVTLPYLFPGENQSVNGVPVYNVGRGKNASACFASADLFVSILRAFGVNVSSFGEPKYCKGPLAVL